MLNLESIIEKTRAKVREMNGGDPPGWAIDTHSTPNPILTYEGCSVIQDEQAHQALNAIRQEPILREAMTSFISTVLTVKRENLPEWMEYLAERINEVCEVIGEEDRFAYRPSREAILPIKK